VCSSDLILRGLVGVGHLGKRQGEPGRGIYFLEPLGQVPVRHEVEHGNFHGTNSSHASRAMQ